MTRGDIHPRATSYEHLFENDSAVRTGFRVGILAATAIHLTLFAITWPTSARPVPEEESGTHRIYPLRPVVFERRQPRVEPRRTEPSITDYVPVPFEPTIYRSEQEERPEHDFRPESIQPPVLVLPPPPVPEEVPEVVDVGTEVEAPRVLHRVDPRYPAAAKKLHLTGAVVLEMLIDMNGEVADVTVLRGLVFGLTESAVDAARQWRFEPSTYRGRPVSVRYILTIRFRLD